VLTTLHELVGPSYALLDPILPSDGRFLRRWRLQLNIDSETLKGIATT
jgi:predicted transcriptional regulator of viral defense system